MRQAVLELERMQVRGRLALSPADITACRLARPAVITHPAHEVPPWHWHWQPRTGSHALAATARSLCLRGGRLSPAAAARAGAQPSGAGGGPAEADAGGAGAREGGGACRQQQQHTL
jgi:hypothetical protein